MAGDWMVGTHNCTETPDNIRCTLDDVGSGMGELFGRIDTPLGTLLIVIGVAVGVVAIFYAIAKAVTNRV